MFISTEPFEDFWMSGIVMLTTYWPDSRAPKTTYARRKIYRAFK